MKLRALRLTNFKSFTKEREFIFPDGPGLFFLFGDNRAEPRLGANAAGKTTFLDALCWVLFGKTPRGVKAGDVCNWDADKGVRVELDFEMPEGLYTMVRTWGPISWKLFVPGRLEPQDLAKEKENHVLSLLGLDYGPFLHAILMAQSQPMFLDLKPDAKASLFSEVMGLDKWLDYSAKASKKASAEDAGTRRLESALAELKGRARELAGTNLESSMEQWEQQRKNRLADIEPKYNQELRKLADLKEKLLFCSDLPGVLQKAVEVLEDKYNKALDTVDKHNQHADSLFKELTRAQEALATKQDHVEFLLDHERCPMCSQDITPATKTKQLAESRKEANAALAVAESLNRRLKDAGTQGARLCDDRDSIKRELSMKQDALRNADRGLSDVKADIAQINRILDRLEDQADEITKEVNPFAKMARDVRRDLQDVQEDIEAVQRKIDASSTRYNHLSAWVRGFKDIRLHEISEALQQLEIEVNSELTKLGLVNWELLFDVDRETKSGSIQRGFSVSVVSPSNPRPVVWESWSGGEAQRLRVAANAGLSNLIRQRSGCTLAFELWDEPTNGMSVQGVEDLMTSLAERAREEQRQIWVVDHRSLGFGGFSGTCTVVKTETGSRFLMS